MLVSSPHLQMQWQGGVLIAIGLISFAIWYFGIGSFNPNKRRKTKGPSFEVDDPEAFNLAPTAAQLVRKIKQNPRPNDSDPA